MHTASWITRFSPWFRHDVLDLVNYNPYHNFKLRPFLVRLQEARKSFIPVFFSRVHNILTDLKRFENFTKSNTADIIYQNFFIEHREHYNSSVPIYTDGSKSADQHLILTFDSPVLPKSVKIAYINCPVKPYVPEPIRCFKCQKFGHTITACRGSKEICARFSLPDHNSKDCSATTPKCYNCEGDHPAYFRTCPRYRQEKEIQTVKVTKNISFSEARKIVNDRTPTPGLSYASAINSSVVTTEQKRPKTPQMTPTLTNPPAAPAIANSLSNTDTITVEKSKWLAFLEIKRSWEETSSPTSRKLKKKRALRKEQALKEKIKQKLKEVSKPEEKEEHLQIHPSDDTISDMDEDRADSDPAHISSEYAKSKFF
ncbi:hypothetical protein AVEN_241604-1 [Araneus ventricosus]|uniref:CCHC-type domain-containing protein n=1 Tax=Araneus ventricosus TaxID=182803 RepID=A0A4Y2T8B1_ARAVE|nr:hypothetical protein AVEN_241604-1 [Araneus ventricosus]